MERVNLLQFLNMSKTLQSPSYATSDIGLINFLDKMEEDDQFIKNIDLGIMFYQRKDLENYIIVDGFNRVLSLSLLLHAICECYKKTSPKNENAIKVIRSKYLLNGEQTKLKLDENNQKIYDKIIFGERLSGKEKESIVFKLLHNLWTEIKTKELQAANIFNTLSKITVNIVEIENVSSRDIYYSLNKNQKELDQLLLIKSFIKEKNVLNEWETFLNSFNNKYDIKRFFKDFFITKFNFKEYQEQKLYEIFLNYFETMEDFQNSKIVMEKIIRSAKLYIDILNVNLPVEKLNHALIQIKMHKGEDTFAYLLNIYEDFIDGNISEATFYEILLTIDEYLGNRQNTPNNVGFNELIQYLNAFITCK